MFSVSVLRNLCAHHSRVYGKWFQFPPKEMARPRAKWVPVTYSIPHYTQLLYYQICAVKYLLNVMSPQNNFTSKLKDIIDRYSTLGINFEQIGMEKNWHQADLWS
jgi:abortive infection bacteriophage resistance protein